MRNDSASIFLSLPRTCFRVFHDVAAGIVVGRAGHCIGYRCGHGRPRRQSRWLSGHWLTAGTAAAAVNFTSIPHDHKITPLLTRNFGTKKTGGGERKTLGRPFTSAYRLKRGSEEQVASSREMYDPRQAQLQTRARGMSLSLAP